MNVERFTHEAYSSILNTLKSSRRVIGGVADFWENQQTARVILRHDADRWVQQSIRLARLENQHGVKATYYFRATPSGHFPVQAIQTIANLGHEVGYHYETLSLCKGDRIKALELFAQNLETFRQIAPCTTVSMHGAPLSPYDNLALLKDIDLRTFGLVGDAVLSFLSEDVIYYTDTGGTWNADEKMNMRDRIHSSATAPLGVFPGSSPAFSTLLETSPSIMYISSHPERWAHNQFNLLICRTLDFAAITIKHRLVQKSR